jgi:hypothetical protein
MMGTCDFWPLSAFSLWYLFVLDPDVMDDVRHVDGSRLRGLLAGVRVELGK